MTHGATCAVTLLPSAAMNGCKMLTTNERRTRYEWGLTYALIDITFQEACTIYSGLIRTTIFSPCGTTTAELYVGSLCQ